METDDARSALEHRVRASHGRVIAALTRRFGVRRFALIEHAVQDAYVRALEHWTAGNIPEEPEGWIVRVAQNALIDMLRKERSTESLDSASADGRLGPDRPAPEAADLEYQRNAGPPVLDSDDELRLVFLCCDPVLPLSARIALVLSVALGLTARQIANSLLSDERTVAQRIVRAKQRLRDEGVRFDLPDREVLPPRVAAVLDVLYIAFSEGHNPTEDDVPLDAGLCAQALRLVRLLTERKALATPAAFALRALLCFHASRLPARIADDGSLLLIQEQDRTRWDRTLATEGFSCLQAAGEGTELSRFHVEAAIAACHALAPTYAGTDWAKVVELYDTLRAIAPSLVVDVNRAVAVAMLFGARAGIDELDGIPEREILSRYPYALAAYGDLHASLGNLEEARGYLDRALRHQISTAQQALLKRKRTALERPARSAGLGGDSAPQRRSDLDTQ